MQLFKRNKPKLDSLLVPDQGWKEQKKTKDMVQWVSPDLPVALSVNFFNAEPDIPSLDSIDGLRDYYRTSIKAHGGALVLAETTEIDGLAAVKTIFKFPQPESGMMYLGSYTLPFSTCSYVVKLQAMELDPTGQREALVADTLIKQGKLVADENGHYPGWAADPYDAAVENSLLMNRSEGVAYDLQFPDHPLSQVRTLLMKLSWEIKSTPRLKDLAPFSLT